MTTRVILYSGGLDSFCGYALWQRQHPHEPIRRVYFDLGTRYTDKEISLLPRDVEVYRNLQLGEIEKPDSFVPQRNPLLVTLAQGMFDADEIALCAVRGEFSRDKHPAFYKRASALLSYTTGRQITVFSPFAKKTKAQAVRAYLKAGLSPDALIHDSVSCYSANSRACGRCIPCLRRWVALECNGLADWEMWDNEPWSSVKWRSAGEFKANLPPIRTWYDFGLAQKDVVTAYYRLWRRTGYRPGWELVK